jgi:hypothetical protein
MIKEEKRSDDVSSLFSDAPKPPRAVVYTIPKDNQGAIECRVCQRIFICDFEKDTPSRSPFMIACSRLFECPYCGAAYRTSRAT